MNDEAHEKLIKSYESRLKAIKERHEAEVSGLKLRQEREMMALEQQYRAMLRSKSSDLDPDKMN